jgi:hypothetical protein
MTMEARPLGATGLFVSRLGFGLAALGRPGYMDELERLAAKWHCGRLFHSTTKKTPTSRISVNRTRTLRW